MLEEEKYREDIKITFKGMTSKMRMPCVFSKKMVPLGKGEYFWQRETEEIRKKKVRLGK